MSPFTKLSPRLPAWSVAAVLTLTGWAAAATGSEGSGAETQEPPAATDAENAVAATEPPEDVAAMSRNLWWNQPRVVELLELSAPQREAMDRVFSGYLVARRQAREARRNGRLQPDPFRAAVAENDLDAARCAVEERGERAAAEATAGQRMVLSVLELLAEEQLDKVRSEIPELLSQRWFLQAGGGEGPRHRRPIRRQLQPSPAPQPAAADPPAAEGGGGDGD